MHSSIKMSESDETPEEITKKANLLSEKSKFVYEKAYNQFIEWKTRNDVSSFSENVFIAYFEELAQDNKPSSLWSYYSMIKSTINIKHQIDISKYFKLTALLKRKSEGYSGKKAKVFSSDQIKMFLDQAPDEFYLLTKVSMIIGIFGACRRQELHNLQFADVKDHGSDIIVTLQNTKTKKPRTFTITGKYLSVVQDYIKLRPKNVQNKFFFLNYQKGKCTTQNVGINKMGGMGKMVAAYLKLPNPELYTGHCFRRSSAALLVDAGGDILALKRHGGRKSTTVAESYVASQLKPTPESSTSGAITANSSAFSQPPVNNYSPVQADVRASAKPHVPVQSDLRPISAPPVASRSRNTPELHPDPPLPLKDDTSISVKWNNYATNMSSVMPSLLEDEKFVDVTLACDGKYIKCHKVILGACSPYFEELLSVNPCQHPIILMKDFQFWEIRAIVDFIYCGVVNIPQHKLPTLLQVANVLQIKGLAGTKSENESIEDEVNPAHHLTESQLQGGNKPLRKRSQLFSTKSKTSKVPVKKSKYTPQSSGGSSFESHTSDESSNQSDVSQLTGLSVSLEPTTALHSVCIKEEPPNYDVNDPLECPYRSDENTDEANFSQLGQFQILTLPDSRLTQDENEDTLDSTDQNPLDLES